LKYNSRCPYRSLSSRRSVCTSRPLHYACISSTPFKARVGTSLLAILADIMDSTKQKNSTWPVGAVNEIWLFLWPALEGWGWGWRWVLAVVPATMAPQFRPGNGTTDPDIPRRETQQPSGGCPTSSLACISPFLDSLLFWTSVSCKRSL
jgi:hypothetical protein